jgi:tetratricopeptide (TPR) repeat protein
MNFRSLALCAALLVGGAKSTLAQPVNITEGELALTPPFCQDVQGIKYGDQYSNTSPRAAYWVGLMGPSFWALHHYCWALIHIHRSKAAGLSAQTRDYMIGVAISDYLYVVKNARPNFILMPEVFLRIGEANVLRKNPVAALEAFAKARNLNPEYWPPYLRSAEVLARMGKKTEALAILEEGLRKIPDQPELIAAVQRLGGKAPAMPAVTSAKAVSQAESAPASSPH